MASGLDELGVKCTKIKTQTVGFNWCGLFSYYLQMFYDSLSLFMVLLFFIQFNSFIIF